MKLIVYTVTKCFTTVRQGAAHNCGEFISCLWSSRTHEVTRPGFRYFAAFGRLVDLVHSLDYISILYTSSQ